MKPRFLRTRLSLARQKVGVDQLIHDVAAAHRFSSVMELFETMNEVNEHLRECPTAKRGKMCPRCRFLVSVEQRGIIRVRALGGSL